MNKHWKIIDLEVSGGTLLCIKAVCRLSDNKVFTVGDHTLDGLIHSFTISKGRMTVECGRVSVNGYDGVSKSVLVSLLILE
jgi:hypothetical protein